MKKIFIFITFLFLITLTACNTESDLEKCINDSTCDYFLVTPIIEDEDAFWRNFELRQYPHTNRVIVTYINYDKKIVKINFTPLEKPSIEDIDSYLDTFIKFSTYTQKTLSSNISTMMSIKVNDYYITYEYNNYLSVFLEINIDDFVLDTTLEEIEQIHNHFKTLDGYNSDIQVNIKQASNIIEILTLNHDGDLLTSNLKYNSTTINTTAAEFEAFFNNHFTDYTNTTVITEFEE
ncbi:hypothetical protein CI105_08450 [Candidatus Izimaplasma bacterium ZiA1]|uniref:hypothetical protein n=1 Tax=Candidatus Izimoplasma sp. ZiA1 TaxID=2024899 RepID=UPI000BAA8F31|nr:hypothetical protein CI105_08450 [Candidatus Izimaplasma bacterium ZiA1]